MDWLALLRNIMRGGSLVSNVACYLLTDEGALEHLAGQMSNGRGG